MGGQKVYAVRKGHRTGVLDSWSECQAATNGYPGAPICALQTHTIANGRATAAHTQVGAAASTDV